MLVVNLNEPPSLLRNDVAGGHHWLKVKLIGVKSNRTIRWPNGATEKVPNVAADQLVVIREGAGILRSQKFGK